MFKYIKRFFGKKEAKPRKHIRRQVRTDEELEEERLEMTGLLLLSEDSWFGDVARKHHG